MRPVETKDPMVAFLYELMRDHVTPGKMEAVLMNTTLCSGNKTTYTLSNGALAEYAADIADRLRVPLKVEKRDDQK